MSFVPGEWDLTSALSYKAIQVLPLSLGSERRQGGRRCQNWESLGVTRSILQGHSSLFFAWGVRNIRECRQVFSTLFIEWLVRKCWGVEENHGLVLRERQSRKASGCRSYRQQMESDQSPRSTQSRLVRDGREYLGQRRERVIWLLTVFWDLVEEEKHLEVYMAYKFSEFYWELIFKLLSWISGRISADLFYSIYLLPPTTDAITVFSA